MAVSFFSSASDTYTYPFSCLSTYATSIKTTLLNAGWKLEYESYTDEDLYFFDDCYEAVSETEMIVKPWVYEITGSATISGALTLSRNLTGSSASGVIYFGCQHKFDTISLSGSSLSVNPVSATTSNTWEYWDGTTWQTLTRTTSSTDVSGWSFGKTGQEAFVMPSDWAMGGAGRGTYYYIKVTQVGPAKSFGNSVVNVLFNTQWLLPQDTVSPKNVAVNSASTEMFSQFYSLQDVYQTTYPLYIKISYISLASAGGSFGFIISVGKGYDNVSKALTDTFTPTIGKITAQSGEWKSTLEYTWYMSSYNSGICFTHTSTGTPSVSLLLERARDLAGNIIASKFIMAKFNASDASYLSTVYIVDYDFSTYTTTSLLNLVPISYDYNSDFVGKYTSQEGYTLGIGPMFVGSNGLYGSPRLLLLVPYNGLSVNSTISVKQDGIIRSFYVLELKNSALNTPYKCWIALARS